MPTNGGKGSESIDRTSGGKNPSEVNQSPKTPTTVSVGSFKVSGTAEDVANAIDKAYSKHSEVFNHAYSSHTWNPNENCMMGIDENCNKIPWDSTVETVMYRDICGQEGITCTARKSLKQIAIETTAYWLQFEAGIEKGLGKGLANAEEPKGAPCNSFPEGTLVLLADGSVKPIEKLQIGDEVASTDPETSRSGARKVDATIVATDDTDFTTITVNGEERQSTLTATDHHPIWSPSAHAWIDATDLRAGMDLLSATGEPLRIVSVQHLHRLQAAYNLTVRDLHTYYVLAGNTPVLVHNDGGDDYNQAMNKALGWLEQRGFNAGRPTIGKFGTIQGKPIGMQTSDGKTGFRIEFDERNGAHINVWSGKEKGPHFTFDAAESTVTKIQGRFGC
ncbi:polymorphic toxin-type HINT domain-containing protein [Streptomyces sp. H10-C2]|uniref:polymorphic toxin-type HINT domain-containing protein n=1 Tax=unclassified Streptomyces TaxID=2593676 RepID=UPI0024B984E3|nr:MULTISPECIES: polymorphic toxin-type HINT domain-containing protein [unclassified Streptomyces]MDJ0347642.1 polymorphic toxin-type HINT domain-containing protein [Streptomyces sp. PH10-H1]MDJ0375814.1 polymorphic toxin-type HINT domain-containing protein [Streptomyces sp. H10-C2]